MSTEKSEIQENLNKLYCQSVAESISEVVRFSLNEEFRKYSFELFRVKSTKEVQNEIDKKLILITQNKNIVKAKNNKDPDNQEVFGPLAKKDNLCNKSNPPKHSNTLKLPCKKQHKSWLQISTEKYKENLLLQHGKKFKYHSEPILSPRTTKYTDTEYNHFDTDLAFDYHLTLPQEPTVTKNSMSDSVNYYKSQFKKIYKDDITKYFKTNLKSHNYLKKNNYSNSQ